MINAEIENSFIEYFYYSFFFLLGFLITYYVSYVKGFASLPKRRYSGVYSRGVDVFVNIIFFILSFGFFGALVMRFLPLHSTSQILLMTLVPVISFFINIAFIIIYSFFRKEFNPLKLLKDNSFPLKLSVFQDILAGWKTLLLSFFPLFAVMMFIEGVTIYLHGKSIELQEAVKFLLEAKKSLPTLSLALFTIIIAAPIIEEFIFRGNVQSYLRKKVGSTSAIIIASALFSFFHFSLSQGFQNIPILISLFILSVYLGFIYEKTRSLISSITLHVTFNLISAIKIIFYSI